MKKLICLVSLTLFTAPVLAQELEHSSSDSVSVDSLHGGESIDRDPAALSFTAKKRNYPGGSDEDDLRVQAALPEAAMKTDSRSLQKEVYKQLYNQDLKEDRHEEVEE